jgi:hypothetical protein
MVQNEPKRSQTNPFKAKKSDVPPVAGNYKGATERKLEVKVDIKRLE